ncbi:MAG: glycosyltransferase family 2 protein [Paracoccaceae bacterium]
MYTLITTVKDEAPYLIEWVAHYRTLGFDNIIICFNDCKDGTFRMLRRMQDLGLVVLHQTEGRRGGVQRAALSQAYRMDISQQADWIFVCDADEFLNIHVPGHTIHDLIEATSGAPDVISIPWRIFGMDGITKLEDRRITTQFTATERPWHPVTSPRTGKWVKSFFRNWEKYKRIGIHHPVALPECEADLRWVLPGGAQYMKDGARTEHPPSYALAQVNHYALRSLDSYLNKRARGRANHNKMQLGVDYFDKFDLNHMRDTSISRYHEAVQELYDMMLDDAILNEVHQAALRFHRMRVSRMRADPANDQMIAEMESLAARNRLGANMCQLGKLPKQALKPDKSPAKITAKA